MEKENTNRDSNRRNQQCQANRELDLERRLLKESTRLDNTDTYGMPYEKSLRIYIKQDEVYKKWKLLKGIREAREKLNENDGKNEKQYHSKTR